jgi:hypothetical protein
MCCFPDLTYHLSHPSFVSPFTDHASQLTKLFGGSGTKSTRKEGAIGHPAVEACTEGEA